MCAVSRVGRSSVGQHTRFQGPLDFPGERLRIKHKSPASVLLMPVETGDETLGHTPAIRRQAAGSAPLLLGLWARHASLHRRVALHRGPNLGPITDVVCSVSHDGRNPILFLPPDGGGLPKGPLDVPVDGRPMKAVVVKIAVNVVHAPKSSKNELPDISRGWFGKEADMPGRSEQVRFHKEGIGSS